MNSDYDDFLDYLSNGMTTKRSTTMKTTTKPAAKKADNIHVYQDQDYIDTLSGRAIYYPFRQYQDIYLEKIGNRWLYSEETVSNIPKIYSKIYPLDLRQYAEKLPSWFTSEFLFGLELWQILSLLLLLLFSFVIWKI